MSPQLHLITVIGLEYDMDYLSHHINFYENQVDSLHYILNTPNNQHHNLEKAKIFISEASCLSKTSRWVGTFNSHIKVKKVNQAINKINSKDWVINPDADEFHVFEGLDLKEAVEKYQDHESLFGKFIDRTAEKGQPALQANIPIWDQYPIEVDRTSEIGATALRPSIFSAEHKLKNCHATTKNTYKNYDGPLAKIYHFKWTASTKNKLQTRAKTFKRFGFPWWVESKRALDKFYD